MKFKSNKFSMALGALLMVGAPVAAQADRIYYLIGVNHVYVVGANRDSNLDAREEIEKKYADAVANDQSIYNQHVSAGADKDSESAAMNADLDALAKDRDMQLGAIFEQQDDLRIAHPELRIEGDGPYQLMGINERIEDGITIFESYSVFQPWPGYVVEGSPFGGWVYGTWYEPGEFVRVYGGWHAHFYHGERFYGPLYGHTGRFRFAPRGYVSHPHHAFAPARLNGYVYTKSIRATGHGPFGQTKPPFHPQIVKSPVPFTSPTPVGKGGVYGNPVKKQVDKPAQPKTPYGRPNGIPTPTPIGGPSKPGVYTSHPKQPETITTTSRPSELPLRNDPAKINVNVEPKPNPFGQPKNQPNPTKPPVRNNPTPPRSTGGKRGKN